MFNPLRNCLRSFNSLRNANSCFQNQLNVTERVFHKSRLYCTDSEQRKYSKQSTDSSKEQHKRKKASLPAIRNPFDAVTDKTRDAYLSMVTIFEKRDVHRRNHVEFIYAALKSMAEFGVEHDLDVYKALVNVMPKGKFIPTNIFQAEFMHYPKQQQCIIDLLEQMEDLGVIPDHEMEAMLLNVFGKRGHPLRKYWRMMYWMPKFKNLSPWPLPNPVPDDVLEIAKLAVERMCSIDLRSIITTYDTKTINDSLEDTWIVSGMSEEQSQLLREHPCDKALYIEGPFLIWLRNRSINYFTLRADPDPVFLKGFEDNQEDEDDVSKFQVPFFGKPPLHKRGAISKVRSVHQQNDGTIFAICATGTSSKDSLLSWIRLLEINNNPVLGNIPIVFRLRSSVQGSPIGIAGESENKIHIDELSKKES